jgi:hypothetical protein
MGVHPILGLCALPFFPSPIECNARKTGTFTLLRAHRMKNEEFPMRKLKKSELKRVYGAGHAYGKGGKFNGEGTSDDTAVGESGDPTGPTTTG